jgi:signal transduction histidine kinase
VYKWYLPTLSEVVAHREPSLKPSRGASHLRFAAQQRLKAEREWFGAIAALNAMLQSASAPLAEPSSPLVSPNLVSPNVSPCLPLVQGVVLSGPLPVIEQPHLVAQLATWNFTVDALGLASLMPFRLLSAATLAPGTISTAGTIPLMTNDPLAAEQFCLVLTPQFGLVLVLGEDADGDPAFLFSFDPDVVTRSWQALRARLLFSAPQLINPVDQQVEKFAPSAPAYQTVMQFSQLLLAHLPGPMAWDVAVEASSSAHRPEPQEIEINRSSTREPTSPPNGAKRWNQQAIAHPGAPNQAEPERSLEQLAQGKESFDMELLQAIAHEVRTPLTTIRTLTRLLLKRKDLNPDVLKRLDIIDQECTEQIDRFNLIFRAAELETCATKRPLTSLAPISLAQVFQQNISRWQQMASQRGLTLDVLLPQKLPKVVTDPSMFDQVLTGLVDRITQTLASGSHIQVRVELAGHQLKLQFESQSAADTSPVGNAAVMGHAFVPPLKSLGQLLMFQPETGSLSLSLAVTKNLFQALGGKLIVKQRPQQGEVLTVYLPLETRRSEDG